MKTRLARSLRGVLVALVLAGCGTSATPLYYTLDTTAVPTGAPTADFRVMVGPVTVPSAVDRPEFVVQVTPNRLEIDEFNRWAGPLGEDIARVVAGNLSVLLGTRNVAVAPFANFDPAYRVTIDVQRFESVPGSSIRIAAVWSVLATADGRSRSGHTDARETVSSNDYDALAAAHSRALATLGSDIAAAIRTAAASP
jgi:uncharacterized lipoprotein YmbA